MKRYQLLSKIHVTLQESADAKNALYLQIRGKSFSCKEEILLVVAQLQRGEESLLKRK